MRDTFAWPDYLIFVLVLVFSLLVGVFFAIRSKDKANEEFLRGSRTLTCLPVSMSLIVTYISAIAVQGKSLFFQSRYVLFEIRCCEVNKLNVILLMHNAHQRHYLNECGVINLVLGTYRGHGGDLLPQHPKRGGQCGGVGHASRSCCLRPLLLWPKSHIYQPGESASIRQKPTTHCLQNHTSSTISRQPDTT